MNDVLVRMVSLSTFRAKKADAWVASAEANPCVCINVSEDFELQIPIKELIATLKENGYYADNRNLGKKGSRKVNVSKKA